MILCLLGNARHIYCRFRLMGYFMFEWILILYLHFCFVYPKITLHLHYYISYIMFVIMDDTFLKSMVHMIIILIEHVYDQMILTFSMLFLSFIISTYLFSQSYSLSSYYHHPRAFNHQDHAVLFLSFYQIFHLDLLILIVSLYIFYLS